MTSSAAAKRRRLVAAALVIIVLVSVAALPHLFYDAYEGPLTDHFDGQRFSNVPASRTINKSIFEVARWLLTREPGQWAEQRDTLYYHPPARVTEGIRVTFVNHATVLIQSAGSNLLTDPVWSKRVSPVPFSGPQRYRAAGIRFSDLPPIDVVLISHNHYDHMDIDTLTALADEHDPLFVVPLGNARYLTRHGVDRVTELDWWDRHRAGELVVHAVPAQHWSRRTPYDTNRALWAGFVIETPAGGVYYAGDTGMGPHFERIRERLGPPRLALLPVGAYLPRWFMAPQHIDPAEAVSAHVLLDATQSMAIHFGTFKLGDDGQEQPERELRQALRAAGVRAESFWIPANGESRLFTATEKKIARIASR